MSDLSPATHKNKTYFAETDFRGKRTKFGIKYEDRARHVYVIGKTGMGKSTMLENMAIQDIQDGHGVAFMDPHGSTAEKLLDYVPESRIDDVVYFAPFDLEHPISFNVMEDVGADQRHLVVNGLMSAFKKLWVDAWSARMEYILTNTLLALLEYPGATLLGVNRMLADKAFRQKVVDNVKDPSVKSFWVDEFGKYTERFAAEATPAIQNKIGQFTSNPLIRNIIGQSKSSFDLRKVMDERKILIINLSKGLMGEGNANLIGSMLITKIYLAAMSRANLSESERRLAPPFYFFVDEFQSFANESFANILSEARKYKLSLTIAHQYIEQMSEEVRAAVFGNVGTIAAFRVGPFDAEVFEKIFAPTFSKEDMVNLGRFQMYLTMMIDGIGSPPFSATSMSPIEALPKSNKQEIIAASRRHYAYPRAGVEKEIADWMGKQMGEEGESHSASPRRAPPAYPPSRAPRAMVSQSRTAATSRPPSRPVAPPASAAPEAKPAVAPETHLTPAQLDKVSKPERETPLAVSLKTLQQKAQNKEKSTGKHSADLKDIIASVQDELKSALPPQPASEPAPAKTQSTTPPNQSTPSSAKSDSAKQDISASELKKMLEV